MKCIKLLLFITTFLFMGCLEKGHHSILIVNNSDTDVYVVDSDEYPDTIYHHRWSAISANKHETKVNSKSSSNKPLWLYGGDTWEVNYDYIESGILMVFILNVDSIDRWEDKNLSVRNYHPNDAVLKRYDLRLSDLKGMNWTITYP